MHLQRGEECFVPLTALVENAQSMRIFVAAEDGSGNTNRFSGDCIQLQHDGLERGPGIYQCSSAVDGSKFLSMRVESQKMQDMSSADACEDTRGRPSLQARVFAFAAPLLVKNTLPCALRGSVFSLELKRVVAHFDLEPGCTREVYGINVAKEHSLMVQLRHPGTDFGTNVALPRQHRASKQVFLRSAAEQADAQTDAAAQRCLQPQAPPIADTSAVRVQLGVSVVSNGGQTVLEAASPLWVLNKTTLPLLLTAVRASKLQGKLKHQLLLQPHEDVVACPSTRSHSIDDDTEKPALLGGTCMPSLPSACRFCHVFATQTCLLLLLGNAGLATVLSMSVCAHLAGFLVFVTSDCSRTRVMVLLQTDTRCTCALPQAMTHTMLGNVSQLPSPACQRALHH